MTETSRDVVPIPPSGEQVDLRWGGHRAVVVEVSGGLREYEVDGRALVDGYGERVMSSGGRGQLLIPWPNRLRDGRYDFAGTSHQVALSEPSRGNAIHGFDGPVDGWWIEAPGATRLAADERGIPVGRDPVAGTTSDRRQRRLLGSTALDTAFTDLALDTDGRAWIRLWDGQRTQGVGLWMDASHGHYMLFTGDSLPDLAERRRSIAVEPMTCAPNAFASGDGLVVLAAGESITTRWGIAPLGPG